MIDEIKTRKRRESQVIISRARKGKQVDLENSRQWVASYLNNEFEDDFRLRYFSRISPILKKRGKHGSRAAPSLKEKKPTENKPMSLNGQPNKVKNNLVKQKTKPGNEEGDGDGFNIQILDLRMLWVKVMNKSNDEVRYNFLKTLKSRNLLSEQPSVKAQTIMIFDWDDTLLCTTFLGRLNGLVELKYKEREKNILNKIDRSANSLLLKACQFGDPIIITNAAQNWVEYSSRLFMPNTHETLIEKNIRIISARSNYEGKFPGDAKRWKHEAFLEISKSYVKNIITNIICLGDSTIEMEAAKELAKKFKINYIKTIKFEENPTPSELIKQQQLVTVKFEQIFYCLKSKMIKLEKKKT